METDKEDFSWDEIIERIEAGETQSKLSEIYGMTKNQFRYRLKKHLNQQKALREIAVSKESIQAERQIFDLHPSLMNEAWTRRWQMNRLVLMAKDPGTLFAYWEVQDLRKKLVSEHFQTDWNHLPFFLQLYDVTQIDFNGYNASTTRQIQVHPDSDNYYIHDVQPGRRYMADFGTTTITGNFFAIIRSNIVETSPRPVGRTSEPLIRFGALDQAQEEVKDSPLTQRVEWKKPAILPLIPNEPWSDRFDGYTLVEAKKGEAK